MNSSVTGTLLLEEPIERFRSFGAFGSPVWQGHAQLRALVRQRLGDRHANVFAVPHYDPETARMRWTSPRRGVVRPWHQLTAEEQAKHSQALGLLRGDLTDLVGRLRSQGEGRAAGSAGFASLLEQAMKVPGEGHFLYLVDEQPVIAFWGFENAKGGSVEGLASVAAVPPVPGLAPLPTAPAAPGLEAQPAVGPLAGITPAATPPVPPRRRPWWHWLLLGLLLLLLLFPLLFLLRSCMPAGVPGLGAGMPGMPVPGLGMPGAGNGAGAGEPARPLAPPAAAQPSAVDPSAPSAAPGGAAPPASAAANPTSPGVVDPASPAAPNRAESTPPAPAPTAPGPGDQPPPGRPAPPVPEDPKALQLPKEPRTATGMEFLLGDWKAGEGLVDKNTKAPLDISIKFAPGGRGEMTVRRPDGTACTGPVQGRMDGGRLTIEGNRSVRCVDGGSYGAPKIECGRTSTGETQCEGVNRDGSRYFVDMRRR